jgi:ankyrin repeat protein
VTAKFNHIEFSCQNLTQAEFENIYETDADFTATEEFSEDDFYEEWEFIQTTVRDLLLQFWVEDCCGEQDFALMEDYNYCFHKAGGIYSKRIASKEFIQILIFAVEQSQHKNKWLYHFCCEGGSVGTELLVIKRDVYVCENKTLFKALQKENIKPESLHRSVELDRLEWVEKMYKPGLFFNPKTKDSKGNFPQHYMKSIPVADFLTERGFDLNLQNDKQQTVLDRCINKELWSYTSKDFESNLCRHLIANGAKTSLEAHFPLHHHCMLGNTEALASFIHLIDQTDDYLGHTPLMFALRCENSTCVEWLLKNNANVKTLSSEQESILEIAANPVTSPKILKELISRGADIQAKFRFQNQQPIICGFANEDLEYIKILLSSGADINVTDSQGRNLAFYLDEETSLKKLEFLNEKGLNFKLKDTGGMSCIDEYLDCAKSFSSNTEISAQYLKLASLVTSLFKVN